MFGSFALALIARGRGTAGRPWGQLIFLALGVIGTVIALTCIFGGATILGVKARRLFIPGLGYFLVAGVTLFAVVFLCSGEGAVHRAARAWAASSAALPLFVVANFAVEAWQHDVSLRPLAALSLRSVDDAHPDQTVRITGADGVPIAIDLYLPSPRQAQRGGNPVLLAIHGGGWVWGSRAEQAANLRWYAQQGFLVASTDYRLSAPGQPRWREALEDINAAVRWVGAHAGRFGGETGQMSIYATSSGAHLALLDAFGFPDSSSRGCAEKGPRVLAFVAVAPVTDLRAIASNSAPVAAATRSFVEALIGGSASDRKAAFSTLDPSRRLGSCSPPLFVAIPGRDSAVPPASTEAFVRRTRQRGGSAEVLNIPFADHVFDRYVGSFPNQLLRRSALSFLRDHVAAPERQSNSRG